MDPSRLHRGVFTWFERHGRALPWRGPNAGAWGVLVSEVMLQQTPVARVLPVWQEWMARWPSPAHLARASAADVLRAWGRLGYPRRALRLQQAAHLITTEYDGEVPDSVEALRELPGVGEYTAAAVAAFAYRRRTVVLDTNVRRVLQRLVVGEALPPPTLTRGERDRAAELLPPDPAQSARWNAAVMELGALVCTARAPACTGCPVASHCAWLAAGRPKDKYAHRRRRQSWEGTDRQARGRLLAALRAHEHPVPAEDLAPVWTDAEQRRRALATLVADGLAELSPAGYHLPCAQDGEPNRTPEGSSATVPADRPATSAGGGPAPSPESRPTAAPDGDSVGSRV